MKKVTVLISLVAVFGCTKYEPNGIVNKTYRDTPVKEIVSGVNYQVVKIDECEYILGTDNGSYNGGYFLTHKGNCTNPLHQR